MDSSPNQEEGAMEVDGTKLLPDFVEMVRCIAEKASSRMKSRSAVTYGTKTLPFDVVAFAEVEFYLNQLFKNVFICVRSHLDAFLLATVLGQQRFNGANA